MATHREAFVQRLGLGEGWGRTPTSLPPQWPAAAPHLHSCLPSLPQPFSRREPLRALAHPLQPTLSLTPSARDFPGPSVFSALHSSPQLPVFFADLGAPLLGTSPGFSTSLPRELPQAYPCACGWWGKAGGRGRDPSSGGSQALNMFLHLQT